MTLDIRKCTIEDIENDHNIAQLLEEYAEESSIKGLPHPLAKAETYKLLEKTGAIQAIGAFVNESIIGFIIVLSSILSHYNTCVAVSESFFVSKEHRKTGAGLKLLHEAEKYSKKLGAFGILISAPIGGVLAEILPHVGYVETNRVFFRAFKNE